VLEGRERDDTKIMSSLVILAASMSEILCGKTDRQTNQQTHNAAEHPTKVTGNKENWLKWKLKVAVKSQATFDMNWQYVDFL